MAVPTAIPSIVADPSIVVGGEPKSDTAGAGGELGQYGWWRVNRIGRFIDGIVNRVGQKTNASVDKRPGTM